MTIKALSVKELATRLGVHPQTLRRWDRLGKLRCSFRTIGQHRRYITEQPMQSKLTIGYARVSSQDQKEDLSRQVDRIKSSHKVDKVITDIGSGMNYKKTGLNQLLNLILTGQVRKLILTYKDRLLRFGSEIIFKICQAFRVEVIILETKPVTSTTEQFCNDLVEIMTVFCSKIYGSRSHKHKSKPIKP